MPNIEIHGTATESHGVKEKIFKKTKGLPFSEEIVVTMVFGHCRDRNDKSQPFLRIIGVGPDANKIAQLVQCLKPLGMDIETLTIDNFFPGKN